ncbi:MAG: hypothetical protein ACR2RF_10400 [Geminicoccaceae bacterium]
MIDDKALYALRDMLDSLMIEAHKLVERLEATPSPVKSGDAETAIHIMLELRRELGYQQPSPDFTRYDMVIELIERLGKRNRALEDIRGAES